MLNVNGTEGVVQPKSVGPLFAYLYRYTGRVPHPVVDTRGWTREVEPPFRYGGSWLLRLPTTRWALVVGWWVGRWDAAAEEEALTSAVNGRSLSFEAKDIRQWR